VEERKRGVQKKKSRGERRNKEETNSED